MIINSEQQGNMIGVLFKSGSYLVVRKTTHGSWTFPQKRLPQSAFDISVITSLYKEDYALDVTVHEDLAHFTFDDKGKEIIIKAYWVDCDEAPHIIPRIGEYRWVTMEQMLLLSMNNEHLLIRDILENLSFA